MKKFVLFLPLLLVACAQPNAISSPKSSSEVYRIEGYYAAARVIENAYYDLPRCGQPTSPKLCSDVTILRKVRRADNIAYAAIMKADNLVNDPDSKASEISAALSSAEALVSVFTSLATPLKVK